MTRDKLLTVVASLTHDDGRVWSDPLWSYLGEKEYQRFIRFYASSCRGEAHLNGFSRADVWEFLYTNGQADSNGRDAQKCQKPREN